MERLDVHEGEDIVHRLRPKQSRHLQSTASEDRNMLYDPKSLTDNTPRAPANRPIGRVI
jgi:hypothetical protein